MTFRFLHLADLHLDTPVGGRTEAVRERVRAAVHAAFDRAIERALDEDVHAVLIAGDAFDDPLLTQATAQRFRAALGRLAACGVTVAWCTGNHDPGGATVRSRRGRAALLGLDDLARYGHERIHVFRSHRAVTALVHDKEGAPVASITSIGHKTEADGENLAQRLVRPTDAALGGLPAIAMLHTQVDEASGAAEHARYAPCSARDLAAAGFDYWALGHVHVRGPVSGAPAWYAGNPQGRNAKETGARGGLLVEVDAGEAPRVTPIELCALRFEALRLSELADVGHVEALAAHLGAALRRRTAGAGGEAELVLRVELTGASPLAAQLRRPEERAEAERALALELGLLDCELRVDELVGPYDREDFERTPSALREAQRLLATAASNDLQALELADVELSPAAPPMGDPERARYLRALLAGADEALFTRARLSP
ncbi:MAG: metallophosphoesterase [Planctomycetota bacterium]